MEAEQAAAKPKQEQKRQYAEQQRQKYAARRAQGLCVECGKRASPLVRNNVRIGGWTTRCYDCRVRRHERYATRKTNGTLPRLLPVIAEQRRVQKRADRAEKREQRKAAGVCTNCGAGRDVETRAEGLLMCYHCRKKSRDWTARRRAQWGSLVQQARGGKSLPVGRAAAGPRGEAGKIVWRSSVRLDDLSWAAWKRIHEKHRQKQIARWGPPGTAGYREHVEVSCQSARLMRETIRTWKDERCSPRMYQGPRNGYRVSVKLDAECYGIITRFAARYTNNCLAEAVRSMIEASGRSVAVLGKRRREY